MPNMYLTLSELYLKDRDGDVAEFCRQLERGLRPGQAFFNSLSPKDQERLRGTLWDPFYKSTDQIEIAIAWLLDTEDK